jgi:uncharacterized protein YcfL
MKKLIVSSLSLILFIGCSTTQQRTTYNTIFTVEQTATTAVQIYYGLVLEGKVSTNGVPTISKAFNDFQSAASLATITAEQGTNALAPASLILEASSLGQLITNVETNK